MFELTLILVGLLAGSLLTEGMVLVPFWRSLPAAKFYELHGSAGPKLFRYFAPLTVLAVLSSIALAILDGRPSTWTTACLCSFALASFFLFFRATNKRLAAHDYSDQELPTVLRNWSTWHHARTILLILAFASLTYGY